MGEFAGLVTVRTSSSRLPEKCLLPFGAGNVIEHVIRRARFYGIDPIVCTSIDQSDDVLEEIALKEGVPCFRGNLRNKLKRWYDCAETFNLQAFHTVDADDPFFDGEEMSRSMSLLVEGGYDMVEPTKVSSSGAASVGYSLTKDIVSRAIQALDDETDTEMMWHYVKKVPGLKSIQLEGRNDSVENIRLTLDYQEDYWLLASLNSLLGLNPLRKDVEELFKRNPDVYRVNWFRNSEWREAQNLKRDNFQ